MLFSFLNLRDICFEIHHSQILQVLLELKFLCSSKILSLNSLILYPLPLHLCSRSFQLLGFPLCLSLSCRSFLLLPSNLCLDFFVCWSHLFVDWWIVYVMSVMASPSHYSAYRLQYDKLVIYMHVNTFYVHNNHHSYHHLFLSLLHCS